MPGNDDDEIRQAMTPLPPQPGDGDQPPTAPMPAAQALPPGQMDDATAYNANKAAIMNAIAQQRALALQQGLWDPVRNMPTQKGLNIAALKWGSTMLGNEYEKGGMDLASERPIK